MAAIDDLINAIKNAQNNQTMGVTSTGQPGLDYNKLAGIFGSGPSTGNPILDAMTSAGYFGPSMGYLSNKPTEADMGLFGNSGGLFGGGNPTLDALKLFGSAANYKAQGPTTDEQTLYGNSGGATGGGTNTMDMDKYLSGLIQNASQGFADPFTNLARNRSLMQGGFLGNILGSYIQRATGQSMSALQTAPQLSNVQLATDLANQATGRPVTPQTSSFLNTLFGMPASSGAGSTPSLAQSQANGAGTSDMMSWNDPGFQTSKQQFNMLSPTAQSALTDLQMQGNNGQQANDFMSRMNAAAPKFGQAAYAQAGNTAGM